MSGDGLEAWSNALGPAHRISSAAAAAGSVVELRPPIYRALHLGKRWRLLLLDSMDGVDRDLDGHGRVGGAQLGWLEAQLQAAERGRLHVILCMHQLLIDPTARLAATEQRTRRLWGKAGRSGSDGGYAAALDPRAEDGPSWIGEGDMVSNRAELLDVIARYSSTIRLSLHGHVHANSRATWRGVEFMSLASTSEYPMQWFELRLGECSAALLPHSLRLPALLRESANRDSRPGRNDIKRGPLHNGTRAQLDADVYIGGDAVEDETAAEEEEEAPLWEWNACPKDTVVGSFVDRLY